MGNSKVRGMDGSSKPFLFSNLLPRMNKFGNSLSTTSI